MLTRAQLGALVASMESLYACTVVRPDAPGRELALGGLKAFLTLVVPGVGPQVLQMLLGEMDRASRTVPLPVLGTTVFLSPGAVASIEQEYRTLVHEFAHAAQIQRAGSWQAAVDYLASAELRALRETEGCVAAAWAWYLVTGELPMAEDAVASLARDFYHLDESQRTFAAVIARSHLASMLAGSVPPLDICVETLRWLRAHAPDAIVPTWARTVAVPS